jgi:hypothetical protein
VRCVCSTLLFVPRLCSHTFRHLTSEFFCCEGLANERKRPASNRLKNTISITGHVEDLDSRHEGINLFGELWACHPRHHDICQHKTGRRTYGLQRLEGLHPITGFLNRVACNLLHITHRHPNIFIIFN